MGIGTVKSFPRDRFACQFWPRCSTMPLVQSVSALLVRMLFQGRNDALLTVDYIVLVLRQGLSWNAAIGTYDRLDGLSSIECRDLSGA